MTKTTTSAGLALYITDSSVLKKESHSVYRDWLSDAENTRLRKFKAEQDRRRYLVSRALVRDVLSRETGVSPGKIVIETTGQGKPVLKLAHSAAGDNLDFSLSHTETFCVLAVSRQGAVGVDVERVDRKAGGLDIARRYFAQEETEYLTGLHGEGRQEAFIDLWTLKEAFSKKSGLGLAGTSLDSVRFYFRGKAVNFVGDAHMVNLKEHFYRLRYKNSYQIAIAYEADSTLTLSCFFLTPGGDRLPLCVEGSPDSLLRLT